MGIFDALNTAVGGLQAQSFALQNISGNIANASTVGYKGINTAFEDLIPDAVTPQAQVAGGVPAGLPTAGFASSRGFTARAPPAPGTLTPAFAPTIRASVPRSTSRLPAC